MATNQDQAARIYVPQYRNILSTVFNAKAAFRGALAPLQTLDGIQNNAKAFSVKTSATPVVIGDDYLTGANDGGFGNASGKKSRFGDLTEVIYQDTDVPYDYELTIHEGIDRYTVNNDLNAALADRFNLQSIAQTRKVNVRTGKFLSDNAGHSETLADFTEANVKTLFNTVDTYYTDLEVDAQITVYLKSELYNAVLDMASTTSAKGSSISLDENKLLKYKDFVLVKTPAKYFQTGVLAIFSPDGIVIPFIGISTARTVETEDFDGVKLQAAAKGGTYALDDNKKAIVKVTSTEM
ncbi:TPA: phage capsid protein [Streptococcus agalactiae]|nr:phage capsid protein [Streptococcus agalactiae]HEN9347547.1 phage capsid protein [Streptococcus agalactiae]HEO2002345.1 phage capsid protein [Streptococcus agalactiae]HEO3105213.1 phage capsid protein [Streptococcus agalactiae]HEO3835155.1 phage capsid protein [Streptococcus agalactiae]